VSEETAWIIQARGGSDEAFTHLVEQYQTPVYNLCYRMLGEPESAEDAAQESFLRAYQNLDRYDLERPFITWLLSIAAHYCIDRLRRRHFVSVPVDDDEAPFELPDPAAPNPEAEAVRSEEQERIHILLEGLDPTDRAAVTLRYWHDFSEVEIAESLSLTVSAVKSRLFRARRSLAKAWEIEEASRAPQQHERGGPARLQRRRHESPAF
jgi:RNA polymerase sigma-70 factor (ECF subfamily)